ncbi:hypothetical protein SAMN04488102_103102 [Alkalibacterium subtropicum]|uniref:Cellobiose phosphorylase n=1 Tax=Alkalibacterium subtropicum TaxID=753702 RepID=A0A1I1GQZ2_9LACT|nr:hypothetical protein [Alkalibacterium subtropicum]SFC11500.1 hypothetical protein SAMN04488102_103102 [Alkalibacterium subtropicum]
MYKLLEDGRFKIEDFQAASPFASFLPGISGTDGIPLWAFYVNRGQGMASFGVENKDNAMLEFLPANKAYQYVGTQGFRTFLKGTRSEERFQYEPFNEESDVIQDEMIISDNHLELKHTHKHLGIEMTVVYYTLPHQAIPGLVREVTFKNLRDEPISIEGVDGLASMFPAHVDDAGYKSISNTFKSWFDASVEQDQFAYYFLRGSTADDAKVDQNDEGNFYVSLMQTENKEEFMTPVFDRDVIFGNDLTLLTPKAFYGQDALDTTKQIGTNKVSAAFTPFDIDLKGHGAMTLTSVFGQTTDREKAADFIQQHITAKKLSEYKTSAMELAKAFTSRVETKTANKAFDEYVKQNYLDNGIRGGFPVVFENDQAKQVFYLYSRKHGDLERDYNFFSISPEYYSQGNGNYRDMNQNRRLDTFFEPKVADRNLRQFMSLIQLDGYNPLSIKTVKYTLEDDSFDFTGFGFSKEQADNWLEKSKDGYTPGSLKKFVEEEDITLTESFEAFLTDVLSASKEALEADHGEGFWSDHWTYNLDLIDSYLAIYPDKADDAYFGGGYRFFNSPASVRPLSEKLKQGKLGWRQYDAVHEDEEKMAAHKKGEHMWIETDTDGKPVETSLFSKLILLAANKVSTLAPFGLGVEMEGGKPGWNDAMNGLPGMFGAGTSELFELKRLVDRLSDVDNKQRIALPVEASEFLLHLRDVLRDIDTLDLDAWKALTEVRESYRASIAGKNSFKLVTCTEDMAAEVISLFKEVMEKAVDNVEGLDTEIIPTYIYFEATVKEGEITEMQPHPVTPFLEGVVKKMKISGDTTEARELYGKVKASDLYDKKLGMYKTSASINDEPIELGRAKFFTPGWLENESVFLHMAYKYLLELVKVGLYDEFYEEIKTGLVVFNDPKVYGRSILENSSFIASSANPDESLHGKGFVARLSGSTVEFLNMWVEMFIGKAPFTMEDALTFKLEPVLPADFFSDRKITFTLFSEIEVTYINDTSKATYGEDRVKPNAYTVELKSGETETFDANGVTGEWAEKIRNKEVKAITVALD